MCTHIAESNVQSASLGLKKTGWRWIRNCTPFHWNLLRASLFRSNYEDVDGWMQPSVLWIITRRKEESNCYRKIEIRCLLMTHTSERCQTLVSEYGIPQEENGIVPAMAQGPCSKLMLCKVLNIISHFRLFMKPCGLSGIAVGFKFRSLIYQESCSAGKDIPDIDRYTWTKNPAEDYFIMSPILTGRLFLAYEQRNMWYQELFGIKLKCTLCGAVPSKQAVFLQWYVCDILKLITAMIFAVLGM